MARLFVKMSRKVGTVYYNPVDEVTVTHEPVEVTDNAWVAEQLALGHIEECETPAAPSAPAPEVLPLSSAAAAEPEYEFKGGL